MTVAISDIVCRPTCVSDCVTAADAFEKKVNTNLQHLKFVETFSTKDTFFTGLGRPVYLLIQYYHNIWVPILYVLRFYTYCDSTLQFMAIFVNFF